VDDFTFLPRLHPGPTLSTSPALTKPFFGQAFPAFQVALFLPAVQPALDVQCYTAQTFFNNASKRLIGSEAVVSF